MGLAKLARTPVITDDVINPALKTVTGLADIMTFVDVIATATATAFGGLWYHATVAGNFNPDHR